MRTSKTFRSTLVGIFLIFAVSVHTAAQEHPPLLEGIAASVRKTNPKWRFSPTVCTCPGVVPSQTSYQMGDWHLGKLASGRDVSIYISFVPTSASAADWMAELGRRPVATGRHRELYALADEAWLWTSDSGYANLDFRNGSIVVEVSGALDDVKFFASHANRQVARDKKSGRERR